MTKVDYHRLKPIKDIDPNQTLYHTVFGENVGRDNEPAIGFLGSNITYGELFQNVEKLASAYANFGIHEGDTVGICSINMPIVQENLLALSKLGVTSKWIDLRIKGRDLINKINESGCRILVIFEGVTREIENILGQVDVELVLVSSPKDYLHPVIRTLANLKDKKDGNFVELPDDKRFVKYKNFLNGGSGSSNVEEVPFERERPSLIIQSSGSTGISKSIVHTEYNFNSTVRKLAYTDLPFYGNKTMHVSVPPFIIYGLNNSTYTSLVFGMKAEMTPYVSETTVYDDLGKFDIAFAAPLHYRYLFEKIMEARKKVEFLSTSSEPHGKKEYLKALKDLNILLKKMDRVNVFVSGGDKISAEEIIEMQHCFNKVIVNGYGNNELTGAATVSPMYAGKPGSVGIPMKGMKIVTINPDTMQINKKGESGEICISSDNFFEYYLGNPAETARIKRTLEDGETYILTGDLGYVDQDGFVYITGRSKRLIRRAAFKIAPETIESVIMQIDGVKDCVVVGVDDKDELQVPMAFVELENSVEVDQETIKKTIFDLCFSLLPDYEIPKYINIVNKIPYKNGKKSFLELEKQGNEYVNGMMSEEKKLSKK